MIYLDNNASTMLYPNMMEHLLEELADYYFNPSSTHVGGLKVADWLDQVKQDIIGSLVLPDHRVIFTSGATEANNIVAKSFSGDAHYISDLEHASVYDPRLEYGDFDTTFCLPSKDGLVDFSKVKTKSPYVSLVSCMYANNETGHLLNLPDLISLKDKFNLKLHVDLVASLHKIDHIDLNFADFITISGHKIHALKGIGAILVHKDSLADLSPMWLGGPHEMGIRAGTENILGIATLHHMICKIGPPNVVDIANLSCYLANQLGDIAEVNLKDLTKVSNVVNLYFPSVPDARILLEELSNNGIYASGMSACSSGLPKYSRILEKIYGKASPRVSKSVRFSLSRFTTKDEITKAVKIIRDTVSTLVS
jgi:cysteine desulfurase